jgi:hypothetical protein
LSRAAAADARSRLPTAATARTLRALVLALFILPLAVVPARGQNPLRDPVQVRVEGYIDATEEQVNPWAMLDVWLERAPNRRFALTNVIVLSPGPISGPDVLAAVQPLHPNIIFNGDRSLLDEIGSAQPNQYLRITGYTAFGPQRILVTNVERSAPITGPTPTPSLRQKIFGF